MLFSCHAGSVWRIGERYRKVLLVVAKREQRRAGTLAAKWQTDPDDQLYTIADLDRTPLGRLSRRTRYRLVRAGQLAAITINGRHFIPKTSVVDLLKLRE